MSLTPEQAEALNLAAQFYPVIPCQQHTDDGSRVGPCSCGALPCIEVGGVQVYVYADPEAGLQISVHLDEAEAPLAVNGPIVPMQIDVEGGSTLYRVDETGDEDYPLMMAEIAEVIDEARAVAQ